MRAVAVAASAVLGALCSALTAQADPASVGGGCDDAVARGVWELAIDLCSPEMLPADTPDATKAHILLGRATAYEETGDNARAAADKSEATKLDPGSVVAFEAALARRSATKDELRGTLRAIQAKWEGGDDAGALADLDRVIAEQPKSAQAYALRASIHLARKDTERAQADIQTATSLAKNCELKPRAQTYVFSCPSDAE